MAATDKQGSQAATETKTTSENQNAPLRKCRQCGGTRFQRHERGTYRGETFTQDEVVVQCLGCHAVSTVQDLG